MTTIIIANGTISDYAATKQAISKIKSYVIACDGGLCHAHAMEIVPNVVIGDMDSAPSEILEEAERQGAKILRYPIMKDETDLELAISHALENDAYPIKIYGALGGRIDHCLSNLHLLTIRPQAIEILDEKTSIKLISQSLTLQKENYDTLSLIPLTTAVTGITTQGLFYPLKNETLETGTSRGTSNYFTDGTATITIETGLLLAIRYREGQ